MIKYIDSIKLYSWNMSDEQVSKFSEKLEKLEWKTMMFIQIFLIFLMVVSSYITLNNLNFETPSLSNVGISFSLNTIIGLSFLFGGYYFTKLFFKTELTIIQFYTTLIYLFLPILIIYVMINVSGMIFSFINESLFMVVSVLYIPLIYYILKELNTSIYIFTKEFNTNQWALVGVVTLWSIIMYYSTFFLNKIFIL